MKKRILAIILLLLILFETAVGQSIRVSADDEAGIIWPTGPEITADGAIVVEATTGSILYEKNIYEKFFPASTTKILTTLVALENSELNEIVTVSFAADNYVSKTSSRMGLVEGEQITMEQALYGIMLESANEGTYAVGEHVGGSIARFIKMMNAKAKSLGCVNSNFANSHGLHDEDHYTCPYDMALIARAAYQNETFMKINGTATYAMPATNKNEAKLLTNHHWFLNKTMKYDYCIGGKTGATTQAGYALVTYAKKDGMTIISVVMHDETWAKVYTDTKTLLDYCFDNFRTYRMSDLAGSSTDIPSLFSGEIDEFNEDRESVLHGGGEGGLVILPDAVTPEDTVKKIDYDPEADIGHGDNVIGTISYTYGDKIVGMADIVYYNSSDAMNEAAFAKRWPGFMIPVDVAFEGIDISTLSMSKKKSTELPALSDLIDLEKAAPVAVGVGIGSFALLIGLLVLLLTRKKRR